MLDTRTASGADSGEIDLGRVFAKKETLEEDQHDRHLSDYDRDYCDEDEPVTSAYYRDYSAGRFQASAVKNQLDDLAALLHKSDKFEFALEQTRLTGTLFVDPEFHPNRKALVGYATDAGRIRQVSGLVFKRSAEYFDGDVRVCDTMSPGDILQGQLGDCYFLAAVSAIAEKPARLQRLFLSSRDHGNGIYAVAMCLNGVWEEIVLDDYAPCTRAGALAFNRSRTNELWVILLEKAWAKVHGGYLNIEAGLTREALRDLTGASAKTFFLRDHPDRIWDKLMHAERCDFVMTAGSDNLSSGSDAYIKKIGICGSHAYSLLAVYQLARQGGRYVRRAVGEAHSERLVKLRNPWGSGEWLGEWSDRDQRWTPALKQLVGFTGECEDGIFFMAWTDFLEYFSDVQICYFHDGYKYSAEKYKTHRNQTIYLEFALDSGGQYYFSVNQRNQRFFPPQAGYKYSKLGWVLGKRAQHSDGPQFEFVASGNKPDKENWDDPHCSPGQYVVMITTPWRSIAREFSFSVYGPGLAGLRRLPKDKEPKGFLRSVFKSKAMQDLKANGFSFARRNHADMRYLSGEKNGWAYLYLENGEHQHELSVTLRLGSGDSGVRVLPPHSGFRPSVTVGPGQSDIIVYKSNGPRSLSVSMMASFRKLPSRNWLAREKPSSGSHRPEGHFRNGASPSKALRQSSYERGRDTRSDSKRPSYSVGNSLRKSRRLSQMAESVRRRGKVLYKRYKGRDVEVKVYIWAHPEGLALLYVNQTRALKLSERISFALKNARIRGTYGNQLRFTLSPGKQRLIEIVQTGNESFQAQISQIEYVISPDLGE